LTVRELGPADARRWEQLLAESPEALVYHHPAWVSALCAAQGYRPLVLGCESSPERLDGVLPLVFRNGVATGRRLISLPHTPVAGPLGRDAESAAALVASALKYAREVGARLELKTGKRGLASDAPGLYAVRSATTFVLRLPEGPEQVRFGNSRNHGRIRWAVAKAGKEGVKVRDAATQTELREWYTLYLRTMQRHAVPPRSLRFFIALWDRLRPRDLMRLIVAERDGRLIAGSILLQFGSTVCYAFNGRSADALALRPNDLIQWHAIHDAAQAGFRQYDMGEVEAGQNGLAAFKSKWGAEAEPLFRYLHPPPRSAPWRTGDGARRFGEDVWRRLPVSATAPIGELVYRWL
jgi:CelD/BcsL family acetyltransferase involved in cellulose biosynthesis